MSSVSLSYIRARQGTSWYSASGNANPYVMGYKNAVYYDQGALYTMQVTVSSGHTITSISFSIPKIASNKAYNNTHVYAVIYDYDPTNYFSNNTAPTNYVARDYSDTRINGSSGTSNIVVTVSSLSITSSATYYVFLTTNAENTLDPYMVGASNSYCYISSETAPDNPATSVSTSTTLYMGSQTTLSWYPYDSNYTYTLSYKFTNSGTETTIVSNTSSSSVAFTPPVTLSSLIPNSISGTIILYVESFLNGYSAGKYSSSYPLNIPTSGREPTCASGWASASYTQVLSRCISGYSEIRGTVDVTKITCNYNSTVGSITATCNSTSQTYTASGTKSLGMAISGNNVVTITVKDSRGYSTVYTQTISALAYSPPSFTSLSVIRCDSSADESSNGTYYAVTPNVSYTSYDGSNTLTIRTRWEVFGGTYSSYTNLSNNVKSSALGGGNLSTTSSYLIEVTAYDTLTTSSNPSIQTRTLTNTSLVATFNLKSNGLGAAFFGLANTDNQLSVYGDISILSNTAGDLNSNSRNGAMVYDPGDTTPQWLGRCNGLFKGNGDGIVTGAYGYANLLIKSWYGVGFVDGCTNQGITVGINCRDGHIYSNDITSYGNLSAVNITANRYLIGNNIPAQAFHLVVGQNLDSTTDLTGASFNKDFLYVNFDINNAPQNASAIFFVSPESEGRTDKYSTWSNVPGLIVGTEWFVGYRNVYRFDRWEGALIELIEKSPVYGRHWYCLVGGVMDSSDPTELRYQTAWSYITPQTV